jgi:hypothetical protein
MLSLELLAVIGSECPNVASRCFPAERGFIEVKVCEPVGRVPPLEAPLRRQSPVQDCQGSVPMTTPATHRADLGVLDLAFAGFMAKLHGSFDQVIEAHHVRL